MQMRIVVLGVLLMTTGWSAPCVAQHEHVAHAQLALPAPPQQRWVADAALRDGMGRIHAALEQLRAYEAGNGDIADARTQAAQIRRATDDIFAKCKLAPERDAVLHRMLAPLLGALQRFDADPRAVSQISVMRAAIADYPRYFDAPTWAVAHEH